MQGLRFTVQGIGLTVEGLGSTTEQGLGFTVQGFRAERYSRRGFCFLLYTKG